MTSFQHLHQRTSRKIHHEGKDFLFMGGTAYLGLLTNQEYIELYKEGIDIYGLNNGTSRTNNVQLGVYEEAEDRMADRFGFESAAILSSGYLAAQVTVKALSVYGEVIYASDSHPSLWLEEKPIVSGSFTEWALSTVDYINSSSNNSFVIISNALDNLKPELYDFELFREIEENKHVLFVLDDSHGLGIVNKNRCSASLELFNSRSNFEVVVLASLAKGLGTDAGVVMGPLEYIDAIKRHPIFMGSSPTSPAAMYALLKGENIYSLQFNALQENIKIFTCLLKNTMLLNAVHQFPVFTSQNAELYDYLLKRNIVISSFPYPLPNSPLLNRVVISSLHESMDLELLADVCNSF